MKLLLLESDVVIEKIKFDIQKHLLEEYPNNNNEHRLQMEKKNLPLVNKLKRRRDKKWNNFISRAKKRKLPVEVVNESKEIIPVAISEEILGSRSDIPQILSKETVKIQENINEGNKVKKKSYAEILKENTKLKDDMNVNDCKNCSDRGLVKIVEDLKIDETNITDNRHNRKKTKQKLVGEKVENLGTEGINNINLSSVFADLLKTESESNVSYQNNICPPSLILDSSSSLNHSNAQVLEDHSELFSTQDKEFLSVLESIENMNDSLGLRKEVSVTDEGRLSGYSCSETVFNLSRKV